MRFKTPPPIAPLISRKGWPRGPWDHEADDRREWRTREQYPCLMVRNEVGAWCGYVGVPPGHPWHGKSADDVHATVHGGVSYADSCHGRVCHVPGPGDAHDMWWVGFDCMHHRDSWPGREIIAREIGLRRPGEPLGGSYKAIPYVRTEVESLAIQAAQAYAIDNERTPPTGFFAVRIPKIADRPEGHRHG